MSHQSKQRIMDKIIRCLALSKSSNEHEAATALRQAHALIQKHDISVKDVELADIKFKASNTRSAKRPPIYQISLANTIAKLFGCENYMGNGAGDRSHIRVMCFVGLEIHSDVASYSYDTLFRQLKQARQAYIKTELKRVRLAKNKAARADAFCLGWVSTVRQLVRKLVPSSTDMALIERAMRSELDLRSTSGVDRVSKSKAKTATNDFHNGRIAGKDAQLNHGMKTDAHQTKRIAQ